LLEINEDALGHEEFVQRVASKFAAIGNRIPILLPTFNNPTYLSQMVSQLTKMQGIAIFVLDNRSEYPPMVRLLRDLSDGKSLAVVKFRENNGPHFIFKSKEFYEMLPKYFIYTDPDLLLNTNLPDDFIHKLIQVSEKFSCGKTGFALDLSDSENFKRDKFFAGTKTETIFKWESKFWKTKLKNNLGLLLYDAPIDTTFALYNKKFFQKDDFFYDAIRVAGNFTAKHLPWYESSIVPTEEVEFYKNSAKFSVYASPSKIKAHS